MLVADRLAARDTLFAAVARRPAGADVPLLLVTPALPSTPPRLPAPPLPHDRRGDRAWAGPCARRVATVPADSGGRLGHRGVHARAWARSRLAPARGAGVVAPSARPSCSRPTAPTSSAVSPAGRTTEAARRRSAPGGMKWPTRRCGQSDRGLVRIDLAPARRRRRRSTLRRGARPRPGGRLVRRSCSATSRPSAWSATRSWAAGPGHRRNSGPVGGRPTRCCCCRRRGRRPPRGAGARLWPQPVGDRGLRRSTSPGSRRWSPPSAGWPRTCPTSTTSPSEPVIVNAHRLFSVDVKLRMADRPSSTPASRVGCAPSRACGRRAPRSRRSRTRRCAGGQWVRRSSGERLLHASSPLGCWGTAHRCRAAMLNGRCP